MHTTHTPMVQPTASIDPKSLPPTAAAAVATNPNHWRAIIALWILSVCVKVLLIPSYRSTDFDVHRHWKAVTRHLPLQEWYFDDQHIRTRHTLDYPPAFVLWEYLLANNAFTESYLRFVHDSQCLALLPDPSHGGLQMISNPCLVFMRTTVILADLLLWIGAYAMARADGIDLRADLFLSIVCHPALLWLDHIHFQYNGFIIGIWLCSMACLIRANNRSTDSHRSQTLLLAGACLFSLLLTIKHLYLTLLPWYTVYLFRRLCVTRRDRRLRLDGRMLGLLAVCTVTALATPFIPFLWAAIYDTNRSPQEFMARLRSRLFPFGRGLVHHYWAGNIWAFYSFVGKVVRLPDVTPIHTFLLVITLQLPGLFMAWKAAASRNNQLLALSMAYCGAVAFAGSWHVHEKAILNTLIPLSYWAFTTRHYSLWWETTAWGTLGLVPLLYESRERLVKGASMTFFLSGFLCNFGPSSDMNQPPRGRDIKAGYFLSRGIPAWLHTLLLILIWILVDWVPLRFFGRFEFLPLALTSLACASGLLYSMIRIAYYMLLPIM